MPKKHSARNFIYVGVCSLVGGLIGDFIEGLVVDSWATIANWVFSPEHPLTIDLHFLLSLVFLVITLIGIVLLCIGIWLLRKNPREETTKPIFNHVEAMLFYPKKYSWEKGERDPKRNIPRKKLILITDLQKAYHVGEYAMNLILKNKIRWHSTDDQNLEEWCNNEGYTLIKKDALEQDLLEPYFEAEIKNKKQEYHRRDIVLFRTHFRGKLTSGFFDNRIMHSQSKKFHHGRIFHRKKNRAFSWASDTLSENSWWIPYRFLKGMLNGYVNHTSEWCWVIPSDAPLGEYRISMFVLNSVKPPPTIIRQKEDTITVVV